MALAFGDMVYKRFLSICIVFLLGTSTVLLAQEREVHLDPRMDVQYHAQNRLLELRARLGEELIELSPVLREPDHWEVQEREWPERQERVERPEDMEVTHVSFELGEVLERIDLFRQRAWTVFDSPEMYGIQEFLMDGVDEAVAHLRVEFGPGCQRTCVTGQSVQEAYNLIDHASASVGELTNFWFDLKVESEPPRARVELFLRRHEEALRWAVTNDEIPNVDRGTYRVVVQRRGWRAVEEWLDFIRDRRERLVCKLVPDSEADTGEGSFCRLVE